MSKRQRLDALSSSRRVEYPEIELMVASRPGVHADARAVMVEVGRVRPNPRNPRRSFSAEAMNELAESIQEKGIINPITVRREGEYYVIVAGDRRYRAALQVGLPEVPCIVLDITEDEAYIASLVENLQREDLSPEEEAEALGILVVGRGLSVREVARLIHKDPAYVSRKVRVAQDPELLEAVRSGVPVTAVEQLLGRGTEERRELLARLRSGELNTVGLERLLRAGRRARTEEAVPGSSAEETARHNTGGQSGTGEGTSTGEDATRHNVLNYSTPAGEGAPPEEASRHNVLNYSTPSPPAAPPLPAAAGGVRADGASTGGVAELSRLAERLLELLETTAAAVSDGPVRARLRSLRDRLNAMDLDGPPA